MVYSKIIEDPIRYNERVAKGMLTNIFPQLPEKHIRGLLDHCVSYTELPAIKIATKLCSIHKQFSSLIDQWLLGEKRDYAGVVILDDDKGDLLVPCSDEKISFTLRYGKAMWLPLCFNDFKADENKYETD